jgi:hypothetical protein
MEPKTGKYFIFFHLSGAAPGSALIHPAHGILVTTMKTLIPILLLALLVGCASPYYPVYVNDEGDYYIAERVSDGPYYGTGNYPWWVSGYPPQTFAYYSPYFYPYYFSVWYPPVYRPYYGFHGGYYGYWYPPYQNHRHHRYPRQSRIVVNPVLPPVVAYPGLPDKRDRVKREGKGRRVVAPPRSVPAYDRIPAQSSMPAAQITSTRSARSRLPSTQPVSAGRGKNSSSRLSKRHHQ